MTLSIKVQNSKSLIVYNVSFNLKDSDNFSLFNLGDPKRNGIREAMETVLQELPQEIIVNILSRLPVKYLIQFKCVCKPWRSLISDLQFAKLHLGQSMKDSSDAFSSGYRVLLFTIPLESVNCEASGDDLDHDHDHVDHLEFPAVLMKALESDELVDHLEIGGSCNGLICIVSENGRIFLWNPTVRAAMEVAINGGDFDRKGPYFYGFGYDSLADDYKVVRAAARHSTTPNSSDQTEVEILSLKSNVWRRIEGTQPGFLLHGEHGIFLNGALHWLATRANDPNKVFVIVAFEMVEERFHELVQIPDNIEDTKQIHSSMFLTISRGCLFLFFGGGFGSELEAWQLNEYGVKPSWTRLFSVDRETVPGYNYWENPLYYTKTGKVVLEYDGRDLVWYDPKEDTSKTFTPQNDWDWFQPAIYIESLVLPDWYIFS